MKRLIRADAAIYANQPPRFTPDEIVQLLSRIEELKDLDIAHDETPDGILEFHVGDYTYQIIR